MYEAPHVKQAMGSWQPRSRLTTVMGLVHPALDWCCTGAFKVVIPAPLDQELPLECILLPRGRFFHQLRSSNLSGSRAAELLGVPR